MSAPDEGQANAQPAADRPAEVLVAGAGIAGLEVVIALRELAGDRAELTVVAPDREFIYKPMLVEEPFSHEPAKRHELPPMLDELGARFVEQPLASMRTGDRVAVLGDGSEHPYDHAVLCLGARPRPPYTKATILRTDGRQPISIDELLQAAAEHPSRRLAFLVPPGVGWGLPVYEMALMGERRARAVDAEIEILIVTPERTPLAAFGVAASDQVADLLAARGIEFRGELLAREGADGEIILTPGDERLEFGAALSVPTLEGPAIPGVPADEQGFIPIDQHARVLGAERLYAAGDGTNFPIKQGGLGTQQADAAAEHLAAALGAGIDPEPFHPVLRGKLLLGPETLDMRVDVAGGGGEGITSSDYLWWPPHKVAGRYLASYLEGEGTELAEDSRIHPLDVEVALPKEWHREPMALDPFR